MWEPVTETIDRNRWLAAAYSDDTLITQLDEIEEDWAAPKVRHGGLFTSSSTLPSLVATMWHDADIHDGHRILEIGTGTGYSTALACERLGSEHVTSVEVDGARLAQAHQGFTACGYAPRIAEADGTCGYWPSAPYDRVVLACSMRYIPAALLGQVSPGGKILAPLSGWMEGSARALLTVDDDGSAEGALLPGTISFMLARPHTPPRFGNPKHWAAMVDDAPPRKARHAPERIKGATKDTFFTQFLAQCAIPTAQRATLDGVLHLVDTVNGSVALVEPDAGGWRVRQAGSVALWDRVENILDAYDSAGQPDQTAFHLRVTSTGQYLEHPDMPTLTVTPSHRG
ncbi:ATP-grasp peptide maturase system methyltransferase [Salinactinospora qingdaonensis]|uniref:Protein-L-isoaspartate O-methyltransferase n=1 Tax=Salinactinospora qingdaonensis TaxID=702744 RepID=A0ABP7F4C3_9ACTN